MQPRLQQQGQQGPLRCRIGMTQAAPERAAVAYRQMTDLRQRRRHHRPVLLHLRRFQHLLMAQQGTQSQRAIVQ